MTNAAGAAAFAAMPKILITSFGFGLTEPQALRQWQALPNTEVRVSGAQRLLQGSLLTARVFHPKLYAFSPNAHQGNILFAPVDAVLQRVVVPLATQHGPPLTHTVPDPPPFGKGQEGGRTLFSRQKKMARRPQTKGKFQLPPIVPGNWRGEIVGLGSVNLGQVVQSGPPRHGP